MIPAELFVTIAEYLPIEYMKSVSYTTKEIHALFGLVHLNDIIFEYESVKKEANIFVCACKMGYFYLVKRMIMHGANPSEGGCLSLQWACTNGHLDVVRCLHENGVDILADNNISIKLATTSGHFDVVRYLHENGAIIFFRKIERHRHLQKT